MDRRCRGFTLIELLIVVAIIGVLAAIAIPNFLAANVRAKVARAKNDMRTINLAIELYRVDHNEIPRSYSIGDTENFRKELNVLTTPIAYMSSNPPDIFPDRRYNPTGGFFPYAYFNFSCVGHSSNPERSQYFLASAGPDQEWTMYCQYDPTNGTISNGDIRRFFDQRENSL